VRVQASLDRLASHEPGGFELSRPPPVRRDGHVPLDQLAASVALEVDFVDWPVEVGTERVELGHAVLAHLALEPSGWTARVRTERRDRRHDPTSAHPPQVLECPRHERDRHVLERLEHGHHVERLTRERQPLGQVGPAHIRPGRTRRMCDRPPTRVHALRVDIELAQRFDHEPTRASGVEHSARGEEAPQQIRGDISVRRRTRVLLVARQAAT
jgi:hypothetical protein